MQQTYWNKMYYYKYSFFYFNQHFAKAVKIDRCIKIILAIASSASIGAWANWSNLAFLWGLIIVAAQVVSAVNEFLPYKKRIPELSALLAQSSALYILVEREWYNVASGKYTEEEINDLTYDFAQRWSEIDSKFFSSDSLPVNTELQESAEKEAQKYFSTTF